MVGLYRHQIQVDEEDRELLNTYSWCTNTKGYVRTTINGKVKFLHKLIITTDLQVDHKDNNKLNNRRSNLRVATQTQNQGNVPKRSNNTSGYKGVYLKKSTGNWVAQLNQTYLGTYVTARLAAIAYNKAALEYFGEFAQLNEV